MLGSVAAVVGISVLVARVALGPLSPRAPEGIPGSTAAPTPTVPAASSTSSAEAAVVLATTAASPGCLKGMASIDGGTFQMGSVDGDQDEKPVHKVPVPSFCLDDIAPNRVRLQRFGAQDAHRPVSCRIHGRAPKILHPRDHGGGVLEALLHGGDEGFLPARQRREVPHEDRQRCVAPGEIPREELDLRHAGVPWIPVQCRAVAAEPCCFPRNRWSSTNVDASGGIGDASAGGTTSDPTLDRRRALRALPRARSLKPGHYPCKL